MTTPMPNPFFGFVDEVDTSTETAAASSPSRAPGDAAADTRFDRYFDPEKFLRDIGLGLPGMSAQGFAAMIGDESDVPLFIGAPSDDFIAAVQRDVLPLIEDHVRRAT